jgi:transcriptional regulator with XRE-family HTH domain
MNSEELKSIRQSLGLSQSKFAAKLSVAIKTVSRWENGECEPSHLAVEKLLRLQKKVKVQLLMEVKIKVSRVKPCCDTSAEILKQREKAEVTVVGDRDLVDTVINIIRCIDQLDIE